MVVTLSIPSNEADFEDLVLEYAEDRLQPVAAQPYGRRGTGQSGIDHQLRLPSGEWVGVQCKRYWSKRLTPKLLQKDLDAAHKLTPPLKRYIVATTAPTTTVLQDWARNASIHGQATVDIWFWGDIERWVQADPARWARYEPRSAYVHAQGLLLHVGGTRRAADIIAYAASSPSKDASESSSVQIGGALLKTGDAAQALEHLASERAALSSDPGVWRVSAAAHYFLGNMRAVLELATTARTLGIDDVRIDALEVAAGRAVGGDAADARLRLEELLGRAEGAARGAVLAQWLNLRFEVDHASYQDVASDLAPADRVDPQVHLPLAQAALFAGELQAFHDHLNIVATARDKIGDWVPTTLHAMAAVVKGEKSSIREGMPLTGSESRQSVLKAIEQLEALLSKFARSGNRPNLLVWQARGLSLLGRFEEADANYSEALDLLPDNALLQQAAQYASRWNRHTFWCQLLDRPQVEADPLLATAAAGQRALNGDPTARMEMRQIEESLPNRDPRRAPVIASRLYLPWDPDDSVETIARALAELPHTTDPDALAVGLAMQLRHDGVSESVLESIRSGLSNEVVRKMGVEAQLAVAVLLSRAHELELRNRLAPARDAAIDAAGDMLPRELALEAIQLALSEYRLRRAAALMDRYFPLLDTDRVPHRLRATLALQRGDVVAALLHLRHLVDRQLATVRDTADWVWCATITGHGLNARHALTPNAFPRLDGSRDVSVFAQTLSRLRRKRDFDRLLQDAGEQVGEEEDLLPAVAAHLRHGASRPPDVATVGTIAVLRRTDSGEQRMVWIAQKCGASAPMFTRVTHSEPWLTPLLGQPVGAHVVFTSGAFEGTWKLEQLLNGAVATQARIMDWATRQGIAGGGVDSVPIGDDPIASMTRRLRDDQAKASPVPTNVPIAMIAHVREMMPFRIFGRLERLRCASGLNGEVEHDAQLLRRTEGSILVDPLTILVAEQLGISDILLNAAGRIQVVEQVHLPLIQWWQEERDHRHAAGSAGLDRGGRLHYQAHTPDVRAWGKRLWRAIGLRAMDPRVELIEMTDDRAALEFSALADALDPGTIVTLAASAASGTPCVTVDGNLIEVARGSMKPLQMRVLGIQGLLQAGAERGAISWLECARAKARLARGNWTFISVGPRELIATLTAREPSHADLQALLVDFPTSEPRGALRVILRTLNALQSEPACRRPRAIAERLFRALPTMSAEMRTSLIPNYRGYWYSGVLRDWRNRRG